MDDKRQQEIENEANFNARNQFILQAGNVYQWKKRSKMEAKRLREVASHMGLSMEVVHVLLEHTANPNAVVEYFINSDDAFTRKIKDEPNLSRMLRGNSDYGGQDGFNLSSSIWRVFMHRIIQQFLKQQNLQWGDVWDWSSLTRRLYEEALRDESGDAENDDYGLARANITQKNTIICSFHKKRPSKLDRGPKP